MTSTNPFPTIGYTKPDYFCDRENETKVLLSNLEQGRNSLLISPRRLGKTALIRHVFQKLPRWNCLYIDLNNTSSIKNLLNALTTALANLALTNKNWLQILASWKIAIDIDPFTGAVSGNMSWVKPSMEQKTIEELFSLLSKEKNIVIALDEFQRITEYSETNTEGWLRGLAQSFPGVRFIYSGSHQRLLQEMFTSHKRPFYRSTDILQLGLIDKDIYVKFILDQFKKGKKNITKESAGLVYDQMKGKTAYIQDVCNRLYHLHDHVAEAEVMQTIGYLIQKNESYFNVIWRGLTNNQSNVLSAICEIGKVYAPTGAEMVQISGVSNSKSISKSMAKLVDLEIVYTDLDEKGEFVTIDDVLFGLWIQSQRRNQ